MNRAGRMRVVLSGLALLAWAGGEARAQLGPGLPPTDEERLTRLLDQVGESVARYHAELFRIAYTETLRLEELRKDMTADKSKEYVFETVVLREELSADEEDFYPKTVRSLKAEDGKPAKRTRDRRAAAGAGVASLLFLLPKNRHLYRFKLEGEERVEGRTAFRVVMTQPGAGEPRVEWRRRLVGVSFRVFAPEVLTVWVDAENYDVLRVETRLEAPFEFESPRAFGAGPLGRFGPSKRLKYVRRDYAARFRRQQFKDPEQTLLVPVEAEWVEVIEGASKPRRRTTLRFSGYRRYRSGVKIVEEEEPQ